MLNEVYTDVMTPQEYILWLVWRLRRDKHQYCYDNMDHSLFEKSEHLSV